MTDETQLKIYGLIDVAEQHQAELSAAIKALKAEREALRAEVAATVRQSLAGASQTAATALETATAPILNRLNGVVTAAAQAEGKLRGAVAWFSWRWVAVAGASAAGLLLASFLTITLLDKFYQIELDDLRAEVAEQQAALKTLNAKGGKARITTCGQSGHARLCVQIDKQAGEFGDGYYVIRGY